MHPPHPAPHDARWVAGSDTVRRDTSRDDRMRADHGAVADARALENTSVLTKPDMAANEHVAPAVQPPASLRVEDRVCVTDRDSHASGHETSRPDGDLAGLVGEQSEKGGRRNMRPDLDHGACGGVNLEVGQEAARPDNDVGPPLRWAVRCPMFVGPWMSR